MGLKEIREVKVTYTCDFCKHHEVVTSEYGSSRSIPKGWAAVALVPADHNPKAQAVPSPHSYAGSEPPRYCLSSDREIPLVLSCPTCSTFGLQILKSVKPAEEPEEKIAVKWTQQVQILFVVAAGLGAMIGGIFVRFLMKS